MSILSQTTNTIIQTIESPPTVILQNQQGVQGIQGLSAYQVAVNNGFVGTEQEWLASLVISSSITSGNAVALPVSQTLSGNCAVIMSDIGLIYADNTILEHSNKVLGVLNGAVQSGSPATVITQGEVQGFIGLIEGEPLYLGIEGTLTHTIPTIGFILQMGYAISSTNMLVSMKTPIILT